MNKYALIGNEIPGLFPGLAADFLFAHKVPCQVYLYEPNEAMAKLMLQYAQRLGKESHVTFHLAKSRSEALKGATGVLFAHEAQAASRFQMDRDFLLQLDESGGLADQARPLGGIGGLMHTLRTGNALLDLCDEMAAGCPGAILLVNAQPMGRMVALAEMAGFRALGVAQDPLRQEMGLPLFAKALDTEEDALSASYGGPYGFTWLTALTGRATGKDRLPELYEAAMAGALGTLPRRWFDWYGAVPVGDLSTHAQFMAAQPGYTPPEKPFLSEDVETRKERIRLMNQVVEKGTGSPEGEMAQLTLLSKVSSARPVQGLLAATTAGEASIPAAVAKNNGFVPGLPKDSAVECPLLIQGGTLHGNSRPLPPDCHDVAFEVALCDRFAAMAAMGDASALRDYIEQDPALSGLDRLYCQDIVLHLIHIHGDMLPRLV